MRGADDFDEGPFTTVKREDLAPASHPPRPIRTRVDDALAEFVDDAFDVAQARAARWARG